VLYLSNACKQYFLRRTTHQIGVHDFSVRLYQSVSGGLGPDTVLADMVEAAYSGYAAQTALVYDFSLVTIVDDHAESTGDTKLFQHNGGGTSNTVDGWYLTDDTEGLLVAVEPLDTPKDFGSAADFLNITPRLEFSACLNSYDGSGFVPRRGAHRLLSNLLQQGTTSSYRARLFKSNTTPDLGDEWADYTECDFSGYSNITIHGTFNPPHFLGGYNAVSTGVLSFDYDGGADNTVYGLVWTDQGNSDALIGVLKFVDPIVLSPGVPRTVSTRINYLHC
jgi:hypothetical protein